MLRSERLNRLRLRGILGDSASEEKLIIFGFIRFEEKFIAEFLDQEKLLRSFFLRGGQAGLRLFRTEVLRHEEDRDLGEVEVFLAAEVNELQTVEDCESLRLGDFFEQQQLFRARKEGLNVVELGELHDIGMRQVSGVLDTQLEQDSRQGRRVVV